MSPVKKDSDSGNFNHLSGEKSPYLQQHVANPVNWYPWDEEAFQKASLEKKPVLLSIGYSACHWCHVMAHESFENDTIAGIMNRYFISTKVDREEYPDVDHLYQTFIQMTTGRGGWPLTVFLTAEKVPFYGGTYFPAVARYGMISFPELLQRVHDIYQNERERIVQNTSEIKNILQTMDRPEPSPELPDFEKAMKNLLGQLENSYDTTCGGFSSAPKFPHTADMDFLLNYYHYTGQQNARNMVLFTLKKMGEGGIFDQVGGGFHRYSTDEKWLVPHFEKMLYDNALLIPLYVNAFRLSGEEFYRTVAVRTADFVLRELYNGETGFYSTLDADSEGREGKFYLWDYEELNTNLKKQSLDLFFDFYGVTPEGNFEGMNILYVSRHLLSLVKNGSLAPDEVEKSLELNRQILLTRRAGRIQPGLDDKVLLDWNGMMISALWSLHQVTDDVRYPDTAQKVTQFLLRNYMSSRGSVYHYLKDKQETIAGYIDDYAWFIQALLDGFDALQEIELLQRADNLTQFVLQNFQDKVNGGFYLTAKDSETTFVRMKSNYDSSTPAGNSLMCLNLVRLAAYTGNEQYQQTAEMLFRSLKNDLENRGAALPSLLKAVCLYYYSPVEITVSLREDDSAPVYMKALNRYFLPQRIVVRISPGKIPALINPALAEGRILKDKSAVFICHQRTCSLPIFDPDHIYEVFNDLNLKVDMDRDRAAGQK